MLKNNSAFTLLEMLLVLFITTLIISFGLVSTIETKENIGLNKDINALGIALQTVQMNSLSSNQDGSIKLSSNGFFCYLKDKLIYQYSYEGDYKMDTNFTSNTININDDGNVSKGGTIRYENANSSKTMTISIGSGKYEIK